MKKLNSVIYNKLILQAEQAKEFNMDKLANNILETIGSVSKDSSEELEKYAFTELEDDVSRLLWKIAYRVMDYYNLESADVKKIESCIDDLTEKVVEEFKHSMSVEENFGEKEPKVIGED